MKKRISRKEWEYIGKYNPAAKWLRPFCSYTLVKESDNEFIRVCRISWPVYLLIFIPVHLIQAFYCMWDGGLKEFEIEGRHIGYDNIKERGINEGAYSKAKEIWEK
jgi:hypothetical protein